MSDNSVDHRLKYRALCLTITVNVRGPADADASSASAGPGRFIRDGLVAVCGRGLMWTDSGVISLDNRTPQHLEYDEVRHRSGQWFLAFHRESDDTYRFVTDFMGYCRLYYSSFRRGDEQVVVVADNQTSAAAELRRLGHPASIDWPVAASHLLSAHTMMQTSYSHRTMFSGIRSLPAGAELVIDRHGVWEERGDLFNTPRDADYEDLLAAGIARAQKQLQLMAESPIKDKRHALSGGRDSRIAMAISVSAGVHQEFSVMTADPRRSRQARSRKVLENDLQVAAGLRRRLGLEWSRETGIVGLRYDVHTSLDIFQSRYAGARFTWPVDNAATWPRSLRLEVHGGSGELIRRAYQNMREHPSFRTLSNRPETLAEDARRLFPTVVAHHAHLPEDLRVEAAEIFANSLDLAADLPLSEQLNLHYANFRNRDHFGEIVHRYARNAFVLYPLAQPEFLQASRLIDPAERSRGRVAYDIIRMTCPSLNEFAFDDGHWSEDFRLDRSERLNGPEACDSREIQDFFAGEDSDTRLRVSAELLNDPDRPIRTFDAAGAAASMAANSVWELLELTDPPLQNLGSLIPTLVAQGSLLPGNTAAKLETMASVHTGRHTPYNSVLLADGRGAETAESSELSVLSSNGSWHSSSAESIRIQRADPFVFSVALELVNGEALVSIRCGPGTPPGTEWAVYLYRERTKTAERWYSTDMTAKFPIDDGDTSARFRALVFSRRQGAENQVLKRYSDWQRSGGPASP